MGLLLALPLLALVDWFTWSPRGINRQASALTTEGWNTNYARLFGLPLNLKEGRGMLCRPSQRDNL